MNENGSTVSAHHFDAEKGTLESFQVISTLPEGAGEDNTTAEIRVTMHDPLRGVPANRSLGLVMAGDDGKEAMRGFGAGVSPRAFGHDGAAGQVGFADPVSGLSVCFLSNAFDGDPMRSFRRAMSVAGKAVACMASPGSTEDD